MGYLDKNDVREQRHSIYSSVKDDILVQKRRQQICRSALEAFTKNGFHETNLREISERTGLAYGSLYDYVRTKDDMLFLIYESVLGELHQRLQKAVTCSDDPIKQIKKLIEVAMDHTDEFQNAIILLYQESRVMKASGHLPKVFEKERSYLHIFSAVLERGINVGVFNVANTRVLESILPLMFSAWALKRWNLRGISKSEYTQTLMQFILQGIGATAAKGASSRGGRRSNISTRSAR